MIGVILAGGKASRLPHKILLPQRDYKFKPIISSAIDYASLFCERVYILVNNDEESFMRRVLKSLGSLNNKTNFLADNHNGIPAAITLVAKKHLHETLFILCGDNIYKNSSENWNGAEIIAVRNFDYKQVKQLSVYHNRQYINHLEQEHSHLVAQKYKIYFALTTPWILKAKRFLDIAKFQYSVIEHYFTKWHIPAEIFPSDFWWDIGTFEAYQAYVENRRT